MRKISKLFSIMFLLVGLFILASCSKGSGIVGELSYVARRTEIDVTAEFEKNEKLEEDTTKVAVKLYTSEEAYKTSKDLTVENGISGSTTFSSLEADTEYIIKLFVSYQGTEEEICSLNVKTTLEGNSVESSVSIKTVEEFKNIKNDSEGYYRLDADLDFEDSEVGLFTTKSSTGFKGTFDGNGHTLSNVKLSVVESAGVFGNLNGATIKNLKINKVKLTPSTTVKYAGALAGYVKNSTIDNVEVNEFVVDGKTVSQSADSFIGGLVGKTETENNKENVITNCKVLNSSINYTELKNTSSTKVHNSGLFAGAIGDMTKVENCVAKGSITALLLTACTVNFGGFAGSNASAKDIKSCISDVSINITRASSSSNISTKLCIGGFIGSNLQGYCNVNDSLAIADISALASDSESSSPFERELATEAYIGGFIGALLNRSDKGIINCVYQPKADGIVVKAMPVGTVKNGTTKYNTSISLTIAKVADGLDAKVSNIFAVSEDCSFEITKAKLDTYDENDKKTTTTVEETAELANIKNAILDLSKINSDAKNVLSDSIKNYSSN